MSFLRRYGRNYKQYLYHFGLDDPFYCHRYGAVVIHTVGLTQIQGLEKKTKLPAGVGVPSNYSWEDEFRAKIFLQLFPQLSKTKAKS